MKYEITDEEKEVKFRKALSLLDDLYNFEEVMDRIQTGLFQSFSDGQTWVITQVHKFPRRTLLDIVLIVGEMEGYFKMLPDIEQYGRIIGAYKIIGMGRDGWERNPQPGWKKIASVYAKDLTDA